jgi:hypothetical protein
MGAPASLLSLALAEAPSASADFASAGAGLDDRLRGGSRGVRGGHGEESVPVTICEIARERRRCEVKRPSGLVWSGGDGGDSVACVRGGGDGARAQLNRERRAPIVRDDVNTPRETRTKPERRRRELRPTAACSNCT